MVHGANKELRDPTQVFCSSNVSSCGNGISGVFTMFRVESTCAFAIKNYQEILLYRRINAMSPPVIGMLVHKVIQHGDMDRNRIVKIL